MLDEIKQFDKTIIKLSRAYKIKPLEPCDIQQELRIALWLNRAKYNKDKGSYKSWAYMVCRNKLKDLYKHYNRQKRDIFKEISLDALMNKGFDVGVKSDFDIRT